MNTEKKKYKVIGRDGTEAVFIFSEVGFLQVEFSDTLCKMGAPFSKIKFAPRNSPAVKGAIDITYSSDSNHEVFWQLTVEQCDAEEIQDNIRKAKEALAQILAK